MISSRTLPELGTAPSAGEPPAHAPLSEDRAAARRRWLAAGALSVLINVFLVLAILVTLPPPPILVPKPIPVRIVPPSAIAKPQPKPKPPRQEHRAAQRSQPKPPPTPPARPPGRLASVDMGDPKAPASAKLGSESPAPGAARREEGSEQPDDKGDATHAAAKPTQTASLGAAKPNPAKVPKPSRRHGGAKVSALLTPPQAMRHHAAYPGPDATEDAYFAYLKELIEGYVTQKLVDDRLAVAHAPTVEIAVRGNGVILWAQITQSSGSKTVDRDYLDLFDRVGRFPPLPRYLTLNDGGWTTVTYGDASDSR